MLDRGSPRSRAIALAGIGAVWRASNFRSCSAWLAAGALGISETLKVGTVSAY